ncbi:MAG: histidine phosphatase family protein [Candidatus Nanohaloarchaea archaeon]
MTEIYLCRHGETDHNREGVLQGQKDTELNETGEEQAGKLADRLANLELDAVYSSDLQRAYMTAERIAEAAGVPHIDDVKLRERSYGDFQGKGHDARYEEIGAADELDDWKPEGGESVHDVRERASEVLEQIESEHPDGRVAVVAHGWTNRALLTEMLDAQNARAHSIKQDNTAVNVLRKEAYRGWRIVKLNDTSHL